MKPQQTGEVGIHTGPWETSGTLDRMLVWAQKQCSPHLEGMPLYKLKDAFGRKWFFAFLETQTNVC